MVPLSPPNLNRLTVRQQESVQGLLDFIESVGFDQAKLNTCLPQLVQQLSAACESEDDISSLADELDRWVHWNRLQAYWLTFIFQLVTQQRQSIYHPFACLLYSDAQINFNHSLAIASLETAYNSLLKIKEQYKIEKFDHLVQALQARLKLYHNFYLRWCRSFEYLTCNPLSENLYFVKSQVELSLAFPELGANFIAFDPQILLDIIEQNQDPDTIYYRVLARRFLGSLYMEKHEIDPAMQQFRIGLAESINVSLETEVGHFHRLYGYALAQKNKLPESIEQFNAALQHEHKFYPYAIYWEALATHELADAWTRKGNLSKNKNQRYESFRKALHYYRSGRFFFDLYLGEQALLPITKAIEQQMLRSYVDNALKVASFLNSPQDIIAELEFNGPRQITEFVSEFFAAHYQTGDNLTIYQQDREVFHRHLTSEPEQPDQYLASLPHEYAARQRYLRQRISLIKKIFNKNFLSDTVAEKILSLHIPGVVLLIFNIGQKVSGMGLVDLGNGAENVWLNVPISEQALKTIDEEYQKAILQSKGLPGSDAANKILGAISRVIAQYEELFCPYLATLLPLIKGKHVKVFPRLQMNSIPFHALKNGDDYLLNQCNVSYGQTLALFVQMHFDYPGLGFKSATMVHDKKGLPVLGGITMALGQQYLDKLALLNNPTWKDFLDSTAKIQGGDLLFACHGKYFPDHPSNSYLRFSSQEFVTFSQVFSDLNLKEYRSVILGACESGLARTSLTQEYIGLPGAFLSAGTRYVIGSLWKVNQLATAILFTRYFYHLAKGESSIVLSLNAAQRELIGMAKNEVMNWINSNLQQLCSPQVISIYQQEIDKMDEKPFAHPYYWAGFYLLGDI